MPRREDDVPRGRASPTVRMLVQAGGFALAAAATLVVFLTDDPQLLRLAVVAVAWAFVLATGAASRRGPDRLRAADREEALHRAYELELQREVAARREYELELENELRRGTENSLREELDAIRGEIASLGDLRNAAARVSSLQGDIAALGGLRTDIARVAALRDDVAALTSLQGQLAAVREDMGRLRAELTEQLSSEMLVERIVMRTQSSRLPAQSSSLDDPVRTVEGRTGWSDVPAHELTGGRPVVHPDEPLPPQHAEQVRGAASWQPAPPTSTFAAAVAGGPHAPAPPWYADAVQAPPTVVPVHPPAAGTDEAVGSVHQPRPSYLSDVGYAAAAAEPASPPADVPPAAPPTVASPIVLPSSVLPGPLPTEPPAAEPPRPPGRPVGGPDGTPRRRRTDEPAVPVHAPASEQPAAPRWAGEPADHAAGPDTSDRLARILAENGVSPAPGGRRRRRYRDDGESDDVLARVLGR